MNYEETKIAMVREMQERKYGNDTQKKCLITLNQICKQSDKTHATNMLELSDVRRFFDFLHNVKQINPSTINNYRSALKFIYTAVLKKEWDNSSFPFLGLKIKDIDLPLKTNPSRTHIIYEEAMHKMVIEMELHGMATGTQSAYLRAVRNFIVFTGKRDALLSLTLDDVKIFMHHHLKVLLQASQTINVKRTAIKFLYINVLDIHWDDNKICNVKNHKTVPVVLAMDEVARLINAIDNLTYKTIAILMYSAGLRVSEAIKLKISDIDSKTMQLLITDGKGNKDRYAILSEKCLQALRAYYKMYKPTNYLFEGQRFNLYISKESVEGAITVAAMKCGINKKVTPHTLRHAFATHLLQFDTNLYYIKQLLGHSSIRSTSRYLHTINFTNMNVKSPMDFNGGFK